MKVSLAILALLGYVQAVNIKADIGMGEGTDLSELAGVDAYSEANRFYNAKGEAIILSQTQGHARIELTKCKQIISLLLQNNFCKDTMILNQAQKMSARSALPVSLPPTQTTAH